MKLLSLAVAPLLTLSFATLAAQPPVAAPASAPVKEQPAAAEPLIVDVHPSPYRAANYPSFNFGKQRFDMRDATVLSLISVAYDRESAAIFGGPTWIDFDRFDVAVKSFPTKPASDPGVAHNAQTMRNPLDPFKPILKRVLAERFHLVYHTEDRPLPGYVVTLAKDGPKLVEANDPTAEGNCQSEQDKASPGKGSVTCTSESVAKFLGQYAGGFPHPILDRTGLTKTYDFSVKFDFHEVHGMNDLVRVYSEGFRQQLGLIITAVDTLQPAFVIDTIDRMPTPTAPEIAKQIPAAPDLEFEVATIKPAADTEPRDRMQFNGSQITYGSYSMQELMVSAWDLPTGAMLGNKPPWLDQVRYTLQAKLPPEINPPSFYDQDTLHRMLQKLLVDRFQIKYHWGEQTQDGWALLPGTPKMKKADPTTRSTCAYGPPPGEKDVTTLPDSPYDHEFYCRNVTMAQFAERAQSLADSEVKNRVSDKTSLEGSYDFTVVYSSNRKLRAAATAADAAAKQAGSSGAADPVSGMNLQDAIRKQLGLRLERQPQTVQALILDHIEQTPTEN